ncbi:MAG TPA: hypothetical protein VGQ78_04205 [Vicinamibacteria bacterium]|jgi:hypothetical protein|nr:hypothetical protein [Vicinamibacteria bacterium]
MSVALFMLSLAGTVVYVMALALGYRVPADPSWMRPHFLLALLATLLLVMGHSFVMFFMIATGVELKDLEREAGWGDSFRRRTIALKARMFPAVTLALALVIANFILGGGAHTRALPRWVHEVLAWATLVSALVALRREHRALGENNRLIAEAASRREDTGRTSGA